jgi:hypothetical protein
MAKAGSALLHLARLTLTEVGLGSSCKCNSIPLILFQLNHLILWFQFG